jgi:hypothetical protein
VPDRISLNDLIDARSIPQPCIFARALEDLDPADRDVVLQGLSLPSVSAQRVGEAVTAAVGWRVRGEAVRQHRVGKCCCATATP